MKTYLFIFLFPTCVFCQKTSLIIDRFVNPTINGNTLKSPESKSQVQIEYGTLGLDISSWVIKHNIRETLNWMVDEGMVPYVAQYYTVGGSWGSRINFATGIMYDIIMERNPIMNNPNNNFLRNMPFAKDWELFSFVNKLPRERNSILTSKDQTIPINIISNHPLLLVNGQRDPQIISTSKSIQIK